MDSRAWASIVRLPKPNPLAERAKKGEATYEGQYKRWIHFYSSLIARLPKEERERLIQEDLNSQPEPLRFNNTLLRVLDKVFYWYGGPETPSAEALVEAG